MPHFIGRPNDFAFLAGRWQVANRRLRRRLAGCADWEHFDATSQGWSLLDGGVSVDEIRFASQGGSGCTLRTLDPALEVQRAFRTIGVPESFLIDREGRIAHRWVGPFDPQAADVRALLSEALDG